MRLLLFMTSASTAHPPLQVLYHLLDHNAGGSNHIINQSTTQSKVARFKELGVRSMICDTLAAVLTRARISHVDFLSLECARLMRCGCTHPTTVLIFATDESRHAH